MSAPSQLTIDAIDTAGAHADALWQRMAREVVAQLALARARFTTDDVWELLDAIGVETHDRRALGAVMRHAERAGRIHSTGDFVKSRRADCHNRPVAVWASSIAPLGATA